MKLSILSLAAAALAVTSAAAIKRQATDDKVVVGYWVPWGNVPVAQLDFTKVTHINYGFAVLTTKTADPTTITFDRYYDGTPMRDLVKKGNATGVKILMSIGGWTGSQTFSTISADATLRAKFINNALVFVRKNTLPDYDENPNGWSMDGIDIDWEYPARAGAICNKVSPNDSANYLLLLKELRAALDSEFPAVHKMLTAAVRVQPFDDPSGKPLADVSAYHPYYDFVNVMAYDIMGGWSSTTGPNAPFNNHPQGDPYSFTQAMNAWLKAGWPKNKLVMGTPFYGRSVTSSIDMTAVSPVSMIAPKTNVTPKGGPSDSNEVNFYCNEGSFYSGMWKWREIRQGILTSGTTTPTAGWTRFWDNDTQTPWLFRTSDKTFLSYDDPTSLGIKVQAAKSQGLRGVMYWDMTNDYNNELLTVLNQIHCTSNCPVITTTAATATATTTTVAPTTTKSVTVVPTTTTVVTMTMSTVPSPSPTSSGKCDGIAAWNTTTVYAATGTKVVYAGHLWTNKWWTQGETPTIGNTWGVWADQGAC
ncbi:hypothetical protein DFQ26_004703 [Actinomortierella ambigua]|nr:hypothetical protein DFQ26_004703 [Actinomortierella ambigua]